MPDWVTLCAVIGLPLACYLLYSGLLSDITIFSGSPPIKKITFAYKFKEGPYRHRGQLFRESSGIGPKLPCIGIYYDKPDKVNNHDTTLSVEQRFDLVVFLSIPRNNLVYSGTFYNVN